MNKVFIIVYVPLLDKSYEAFIPINRKIGTIKEKIIDVINNLSDNALEDAINLRLYNKETSREYNYNLYVKESKISNGTKMLLL